MHQSSIVIIALVRANLLSARTAMSSANTITEIPSIQLRSTTKSLMTILKKKGDVLFPWGHPQFKLIILLCSYILIWAVDKSHLAIKNSCLCFPNVSSSFLIKILWLILSNAFLRSKNAVQVHNFFCYLIFSRLIILNKWTSHPYSGTNPS